MATDYDAPRKTDDDLSEDSIEELKARRVDKSSSSVDVDETEQAEGFELPGADLSGEELSVRVIPRQADEFTCTECYLVHHRRSGPRRRPKREPSTSTNRPVTTAHLSLTPPSSRDDTTKITSTAGATPPMATDYDAPRKTDDDLSEDSIEELKARRVDKSASSVDVDETEQAEGFELPGADLSGEELSVRVIPRQADEFTCAECYLVHHRSQLASDKGGKLVCRECAA
jgi:hypothetical protein